MFDLTIFLNALTSMFVIIDPVGGAMIFHGLVGKQSVSHRRFMSFKTFIISTILIIVFGKYGQNLLGTLGISIHAFGVSGGILLFYTAFHMIVKNSHEKVEDTQDDISVYPMSIPMIAGPGTLTLSVLLFSKTSTAAGYVSVSLAIICVTFATLVLMLYSKLIKDIIGQTGDDILQRFLGVLLAALAIQFVHDGLIGFTQ
ncbi:MAG: MarC family protein [Candidatus Cloacimonetes bacterium]|nr:MarC family protein [Candidatus Cloacimonadota bacterium]